MAYVVIAKWTANDGEEERVATALGLLIEPSRAEAGNLQYQVHRDPNDPRVFLLYEKYIDEDAYAAHRFSAHFQKHAVGNALARLGSRERSFYVTWEGGR